MKFSLAAVSAIACTSHFASGSSLRHRALAVSQPDCPGGANSPLVELQTTECTAAAFLTQLAATKGAACTLDDDVLLAQIVGGTNATLDADVRALCLQGYNDHTTMTFNDITQQGEQFNEEYFAGGTKWNYEKETNDGDNVLKYDAQRVGLIRDNEAEDRIIELPLHLKSFDADENGCDINAAYCCWVKDRQANDNNGNCATPYDSDCIDKNPADNANLCYVDHTRAPGVSHVAGGFTIFGDLQSGKENIEGAIHCHGFAWANDVEDNILDGSRIYKGNNLYFVSMFDHLYTRGYAKNVPGSPMCGCAENMAVVTRADCTEIDATERFDLFYNGTDVASGASIDVTTIDINFNACTGKNDNNNDLEAYYERLVDEGKATADDLVTLRTSLVGDTAGECNDAIRNFLGTKGINEEPQTN